MTREYLVYVFWALVLTTIAAGDVCTPAPAAAQTDGSAEPTVIRWRTGADTLPPYSDWHEATVQPTAGVHDATLVGDELDAFRWFEHVSGPQACVFTATAVRDREGVLRPGHDAGGGRDCSAHVRDSHCGYVMPGWTVWAASGGACASFGITPCSGICW